MSDLFTTQDEVTQDECDAHAEKLTNSTVTVMRWQGYHSYTLLTTSGIIVQFRSKASPLDIPMVELAKTTHRHLAPTTTYHGFMHKSSVTVWLMELLPGTGYLFTVSSLTPAKQEATITGMARFFADSWRNAQVPIDGGIHPYHTKLQTLLRALPARFTPIIERLQGDIAHAVSQVPWVLTHKDLSNMNILVDPDTGHLTGIVDWADAAIEQFGMALWGLEAVLGCSGPSGWAYFEDDTSHSRLLFREAFFADIGERLSDQTCAAIDQIRNLGVMLRYGFTWETGVEKPVENTSLLDVFLRSSFSGDRRAMETTMPPTSPSRTIG